MEKKLTVIQMAKHLGVSKEAIYNRIRRGSLNAVMENGRKYVLLTKELEEAVKSPKKSENSNLLDTHYIELLKEQIKELKEKNEKLESDKENLIRQKEKLLIESKEKVESIYKSRDEYIKSILSAINIPTLENNSTLKDEVVEVDEVEDEIDIVEQICESFEGWIEFDTYIQEKGYSKKEIKIIRKKIKKEIGNTKMLKVSSGELFIKEDAKLKKIIGKI